MTLTPSNDQSGAASIIDAIKSLHGASPVALSEYHPMAYLVPKGMELENLKSMVDQWRTTPERVRQHVAAGTVDALIDYVNRFKSEATLGFFEANTIGGMLVALDYHNANGEDGVTPSHVTHLCSYRFPLSNEMNEWLDFAKKPQPSPDFAEFLLDRAHDIESPPIDWMMVEAAALAEVLEALNLHDDRVPLSIEKDARGDYVGVEELAEEFTAYNDPEGVDPDGPPIPRTAIYKLRKIRFANANTLVSLARNVQINSQSKAKSAYDPKSGNMSIVYEEESQATSRGGERVKVPDGFFLFIPVFQGEPPRLIPCRLKHRVHGGSVVWKIEIADAGRMIDRAISSAAERAASATGVPMLRGLPIGDNVVEALTAEAKQAKRINPQS